MVGMDGNGVLSFKDGRILTPQLKRFDNTCELFIFGCVDGWERGIHQIVEVVGGGVEFGRTKGADEEETRRAV